MSEWDTAIQISLIQTAKFEGYDSFEEMIDDFRWSSIVPACCSYGCQVEPDGKCEHGFPSVLLVFGCM